jgi:hypothetical protein
VSVSESTESRLTCAACGRVCVEVDDGRGWFHLEITREEPVDDLHWWEVDFCSQSHAADWLAGPLPAPIRSNGEPRPRTTAERVEDAGCLALFVLVVFLIGLGLWTAGRFLIGLF